ncbi:coenzyme PQQ synthesis protein D [mine drainage metagenome]|uniref:Coenzyme PQQ synthesis protein D n=1 Tax=mine drainage metagenome TaxID=410659 RepID=A0A1J5QJ32_9ZZZZ
MSDDRHFQPKDRPQLNSKFLFRWEKSQDAYVLLYPEGVIKLNASASEIIKRCTGKSTVGEIVKELKTLFVDTADIETSIYRFLEVSHAKGWIGN